MVNTLFFGVRKGLAASFMKALLSHCRGLRAQANDTRLVSDSKSIGLLTVEVGGFAPINKINQGYLSALGQG